MSKAHIKTKERQRIIQTKVTTSKLLVKMELQLLAWKADAFTQAPEWSERPLSESHLARALYSQGPQMWSFDISK